MNKTVSPSRTYVIICEEGGGSNNHCFRKFKLPKEMPNNSSIATWYYVNKLDLQRVVLGSVTFEDYSKIKDMSKEEIE